MGQREDIRAYLESLTLKGEKIVDWGSGAKPVEKYLNHSNCEFFKIDLNKSTNPDLVVDITEPVVLAKLYDQAFCMEVLEHVIYPLAVLMNIYNNLRPGGKLHLSVPFMYPVHGENDYLRYTEHGLRALTEEAGMKVDFIKPTSQGYLMRASREL